MLRSGAAVRKAIRDLTVNSLGLGYRIAMACDETEPAEMVRWIEANNRLRRALQESFESLLEDLDAEWAKTESVVPGDHLRTGNFGGL